MKTYTNMAFLLYFVLIICQPQLLHANHVASLRKNNLSFDLDNDCFMVQNKDKDYTYSVGLNYSFIHGDNSPWFIHKPLGILNDYLFTSNSWKAQVSNVGVGMYGFTPRKKRISTAFPLDRPYASLNYLSFAGLYLSNAGNFAVKSAVTFGFLGLNHTKNVQNAYHTYAGFNSVKGWSNQISQGGEFTFKYAIEGQGLFFTENKHVQIMHAFEASLGYITELNFSLYMRIGKIASPWWSYQPAGKNYGEKNFTLSSPYTESYFTLGLVNKIRGYNSFLQGQFKKSSVTMKPHQIKPFIMGAWIGFTQTIKQGFRISYQVNFQSSEVKTGSANRSMTWGSFVISQNW